MSPLNPCQKHQYRIVTPQAQITALIPLLTLPQAENGPGTNGKMAPAPDRSSNSEPEFSERINLYYLSIMRD